VLFYILRTPAGQSCAFFFHTAPSMTTFVSDYNTPVQSL